MQDRSTGRCKTASSESCWVQQLETPWGCPQKVSAPAAVAACLPARGDIAFCSAEAWSATTRNTPFSWLSHC